MTFQDEYVRRSTELASQGTAYNPNELYLDVTGWRDKKGRI
jgi:hypothetical protein